MIDLPFRQHKLTFLILGICLLVGLFWGIRLLSLQFLLINSQRLGEDKLLNYVTDLRRELTDYRFLPYTLTDNPDVRYFLDQPNLSNESSPASLQRQ